MSDYVDSKLHWDLHWARKAVERLERALAKARRVVELRVRERAEYAVSGVVPKRKSVRDTANQEVIDAGRRRGVIGKRGQA